MLNTIEERITFVKELKSKIEHEFTDNNYQVFVFGSFLTEEYAPDKSDIDIGIYCESIATAIDMKHFIEDELNADYIIPNPFDKRVAPAVAEAVKEAARKAGLARI